MKIFAIRLSPENDLKNSIIEFVKLHNIKAGFILSCAGSLSCARLRMADENLIKEFNSKFEIISLSGTLSLEGVHLHIGLSDKDGNMLGGHLLDGCKIYTTAEIIIGTIEDKIFSRKFDGKTGFCELVINEK